MTIPLRIDDLDLEGRRDLQRKLIKSGFLDPYRADGRPSDDGILGPVSMRAFESYWDAHPDEIEGPLVVPAPAAPWWQTRRGKGTVKLAAGLVVSIVGLFWSGAENIDAGQAVEIIYEAGPQIDAAISIAHQLIEILGLLLAALGLRQTVVGAWAAKGPVDPTLLARVGGRDVRLPGRVRRDALPADDNGVAPSRHWPRRGPFDEGH